MTHSDASKPLSKVPGAYSEATIDDEVVVMSLDSGEFFSLTGTALAVWRGLDDGPTKPALLAGLAEEFGTNPASIEPDCDAFLNQLIAAGFVVGG